MHYLCRITTATILITLTIKITILKINITDKHDRDDSDGNGNQICARSWRPAVTCRQDIKIASVKKTRLGQKNQWAMSS